MDIQKMMDIPWKRCVSGKKNRISVGSIYVGILGGVYTFIYVFGEVADVYPVYLSGRNPPEMVPDEI